MAKTSIEWATDVWNPITGCTKISPGCKNCYMFRLYPRLKGMGVKGYEEDPDVLQLVPERLRHPLRWQRPRRVFVNSMSDMFHEHVPDSYIREMFKVMTKAHLHIFQILTKRPERADSWWFDNKGRFGVDLKWPDNIWIGTSVENDRYAFRMNYLSRLPAKIRFVSAEPLIDELDIRYWVKHKHVNWVIVGGESGPGARPMDEAWARWIRDNCLEFNVPFFYKQKGGVRDKHSGSKAILDGKIWTQLPKMSNCTKCGKVTSDMYDDFYLCNNCFCIMEVA